MAPKRLLSLDGGGIRGLVMLLILQHLMEKIDPDNPPKPCEYFDLIGGTSTGGLIAVMLGRLEMDIQTAIKAYTELCDSIFTPERKKLSLLRRASDLMLMKGRFNTAALEHALKTTIDAALGEEDADFISAIEPKCRVFVCAIRHENSQPVFLKSYRSRRGKEVKCKIWEACRATAAASSFFDPITIGPFKEQFVDGAVGFNNPVNEVLAEAQEIWPSNDPLTSIQCVVSIGAGQPPLRSFGSTVFEVSKTLIRIATETEQTAEAFLRMIAERKYFRFNVLKGLEDIGLQEHMKLNILAAATRNYLASQTIHIQTDSCVDALRNTATTPKIQVSSTQAPPHDDSTDPETSPTLDTDSSNTLSSPIEAGAKVEDVQMHDSFQSWLSSFEQPGKGKSKAQQQPDPPQISREDFQAKMARRNHDNVKDSFTSAESIPSIASPGPRTLKVTASKTVTHFNNRNSPRLPIHSGQLGIRPQNHIVSAHASFTIQDVPHPLKSRLRRRIQQENQAHFTVQGLQGPQGQAVLDTLCPMNAPLVHLIKLLKDKGYSGICGFRVVGETGSRIGLLTEKCGVNPVTVTDGPSSYSLRDGYRINVNETLINFYNRRFLATERTKAELLRGSTRSLFLRDSSNEVYIEFKRTLRVPENGIVYELPPPMDSFPLLSAKAFEDTLPPSLAAKGGLFFPMLQREALLLEFTSDRPLNHQFAIRIFAGSVNVLTGSVAGKHTDGQQDYIVAPMQHHLSGFSINPDEFKQFVAMPMGDAYSIEKQITGREYIGGIQLEIVPRYRETGIFGQVFGPTGARIEVRDLKDHKLDQFSTPNELGSEASERIFMADYNPENVYDYDIDCPLEQDVRPLVDKRSRPTFVRELFDGPRYSNYDPASSLLIEPIMAIELLITPSSKGLKPFTLECSPLATLAHLKDGIMRKLSRSAFKSVEINGTTYLESDVILDELHLKDGAEVILHTTYAPERYGCGNGKSAATFDKIDIPGWDMGLSAGGNVKQDLARDPNPRIWDWTASRIINIQILNAISFQAVTGLRSPATPISFEAYRSALIPRGVSTQILHPGMFQNRIARTKSVGQIDAGRVVNFDTVLKEGELMGCTCCESNLCDSILDTCKHIFCNMCIAYYMTRDRMITCGLCDLPASRIIRFSAGADLGFVAGASKPRIGGGEKKDIKDLHDALKFGVDYGGMNLKMEEILPLLACTNAEDITTATLQMAIMGISNRAPDTGLFQLLLGQALSVASAVDKIDVVALVRTCLERYNAVCLDLVLSLFERDGGQILADAAAIGCDFYKTVKRLSQMEGLGTGSKSMRLLTLHPDRMEERRNEAVGLLVRTFGFDVIVLLTRVGIIEISKDVKRTANSGVADALRIIKATGSDLSEADSDGETALHRAYNGEVAKLLLDSGCKVKALDGDKNTPLHMASGRGLGGVIQVLLDAGGSEVINDYNNFGKTAYHYSERHPDVRRRLVAAGADPELPVKK